MTGTKAIIPYRGIADHERIVTCRLCGGESSVGYLIKREGECSRCSADICVYCGCSNERGCIHPSFPNGELTCEWQDRGLCSFCFNQFAEEQYLLVTGRGHLIQPMKTAPRPLIVMPV